MREIGLDVPQSGLARSTAEAVDLARTLGFPVVIRPSFTLGGVGGGIAYNIEEFRELAERGLELSPVHEILIEESVIGWKEFELEVMRDVADNFVVICSIENIDPMGVHTGDSITVAPILTLTDKEYQRMRDAARRIISKVGVETGGSNIQFAVDPANGRMVVIEMNPRVSRVSALASKATGFPIAKIAAKLALGYHLDEIPNDITRLTPASFEPTIDYVVVKIPRWNFEKFPQADRTLDHADEVGRRGDGDRPDVQGSVHEGRALARARAQRTPVRARGCRPRWIGRRRRRGRCEPQKAAGDSQRSTDVGSCSAPSVAAGASIRFTRSRRSIRGSFSSSSRSPRCGSRPTRQASMDWMPPAMRRLKRAGFGDQELALAVDSNEATVRERRLAAGLKPVYKRVDTCAAEFESFTPYLYSSYEGAAGGGMTKPIRTPGQGHDPWQRTEPNRTGHRVRLLLLPRGLRAEGRRPRDRHDQLQSRDRLDRLRHR